MVKRENIQEYFPNSTHYSFSGFGSKYSTFDMLEGVADMWGIFGFVIFF
jgi:hypothetical protein